MKKEFLLTALCLLLSLAPSRAQVTIDAAHPSPYVYRFFVKNDVPPTPLPGADASKARWVNFWMFKDGFFSQADTLTRTFSSQGRYTAELRRRGTYSGTPEPPHARIAPNLTSTTDPGTSPGGPAVSNLGLGQLDRIQPQWSAAQPNDTICLALIIHNPSNEIALSGGTLKLRFPTGVFSYAGQVFNDQPGFTLRSVKPETDAGDATYAPGSVLTWDVATLQAAEERVLFVCIKAQSDVPDSTFHDLWLEWSGAISNSQDQIFFNTSPGTTSNTQEDKGATTAVTFKGTSRTTISMNLARDPNALYVDPTALTPARNAPPQQLMFTVHAENLGGAMANNLTVDVFLDERIDLSSLVLGQAHFPSSPTLTLNMPAQIGPHALRWDFPKINLQATHGDEAAPDSQYTQASFTFLIKTLPGIDLVEGRHIVSRAKITMSTISSGSGSRNINDVVMTNPAIVRLDSRCRGRIPFGHVFGIKGHLDLSGASAAASSQGLGLTWRFPLVRRCGNSLSSNTMKFVPRLFWQVEAGWGNGSFENPATGLKYDTRHIHFSPVQLRLYRKINQTPGVSWLNVSAGYSADYTWRLARVGGGQVPLPGGFGDRLEHELFASVGLGNTVGVPGYSVNVGYKYRFNRLVGPSIDYGFPFVSVQVDLVRLSRHFAQVWTHTYRW